MVQDKCVYYEKLSLLNKKLGTDHVILSEVFSYNNVM
jgi:hypothetical protein